MLRTVATALAGRQAMKLFGQGALGKAAVAALPFVAARGLGPLGATLTAGYVGKKLYERRQASKLRTYPATATPAQPPAA